MPETNDINDIISEAVAITGDRMREKIPLLAGRYEDDMVYTGRPNEIYVRKEGEIEATIAIYRAGTDGGILQKNSPLEGKYEDGILVVEGVRAVAGSIFYEGSPPPHSLLGVRVPLMAASNALPNAQNIYHLTNGILKHNVSDGVSTMATAAASTDYVAPNTGTDVINTDMIASEAVNTNKILEMATAPNGDVYKDSAALKVFKFNLSAAVDPTTTDDSTGGYSVGSRWLNTVSGEWFICSDATPSAAVWQSLTASGSSVDLSSPPPIGDVTPNTGGFTTLQVSNGSSYNNFLSSQLSLNTYNNSQPGMLIATTASRGTFSSQLPLLDGNFGFGIQVEGNTGDGQEAMANIMVIAAEDFEPGKSGARIEVATTTNGTTTPVKRLTIDHDGAFAHHATKFGIRNVTPVAMPASTDDLKNSLQAQGLIHATDTATPLNLDGGALTAGAGTFSGNLAHTGTNLGFRNASAIGMPTSTADIKNSLQTVGLLHATDAATPLNLDGGQLTVGLIQSDPAVGTRFLVDDGVAVLWRAAVEGAITVRRSQGTIDSPSGIGSGTALGAYRFDGRDNANNWVTGADIGGVSAQSWTSTLRGTNIRFRTRGTTSGAALTTKFIIDADGDFAFGTAAAARQTYGVPTGTLSRATFATGSVTTAQLAQRVAQLIIDLQSHGILL